MVINPRCHLGGRKKIIKKYIAKFEVEIEMKSNNDKNANSLLREIKFDKSLFGSKGEVKTIRSELKSFYKSNK